MNIKTDALKNSKNLAEILSDQYDLKESEKTIGQMLPIIKDAHGKVVDGKHRKETDPDWREEIREEIKTEEDYWKARAHLNFSRRNAHDARQEKLDIVNNLAEYYVKQGLNVLGPERLDGKGAKINEVLAAVIKALKGAIPESWIRQNIDAKYLQKQNRNPLQETSDVAERHEQEGVQKFFCPPKDMHGLIPESVSDGEKIVQNLKPSWAEIFEVDSKSAIESISRPLETFTHINVSILSNLDNEQKEKVLAVLLESRRKIDEMVKVIKDKK